MPVFSLSGFSKSYMYSSTRDRIESGGIDADFSSGNRRADCDAGGGSHYKQRGRFSRHVVRPVLGAWIVLRHQPVNRRCGQIPRSNRHESMRQASLDVARSLGPDQPMPRPRAPLTAITGERSSGRSLSYLNLTTLGSLVRGGAGSRGTPSAAS